MRRVPLLLCLLTGCWVSAQHGEQIDQRLKTLEADDQDHQQALLEQRKQLADLIPRIDAKLQEMDQTLQKLNQATHQTGADVGERLDQLQGQMQSLRGLLEETQHRLEQLSASEDAKFAAVLGPQAMAEFAAREKAMAMAPSDRVALLAAANKQLSDGDPAVARELFGEYLRRYPKDAQAGDAQFGLADTYFKEGKYKESALGFQKVPDQYPLAAMVCDARLNLGLSLAGLKLLDDARAALEETLKHCAAKPAVAKQARDKLKELKKGTSAKPKKTGGP